MNTNKKINILLKNISEGDYASAKGVVSQIIEAKIAQKIKTISKTTDK